MNKFKANEIQLIKKAKETFKLAQIMQKSNGQGLASWNEDWVCFLDGHRVTLPFSMWVNDSDASKYDLVRAFALENVNENIAPGTKRSNVQYATRAMNVLSSEICVVEQYELDRVSEYFTKNKFKPGYLGAFWNWCKKNELLPLFLRTPVSIDNRQRSPEEYDNQKSKLISEAQVAAVGVLYNELFSDTGLQKYGVKNYLREYIATAFCTLALSTPSRGDAEVWALPNQRVKTQIDDETGEETHSIFWKGSKGHPDNRTHIITALKDQVDRVLNVLEKEFFQGKVLSFFMANPSLSLNKVIEAYPDVNYKVADYPNLNLDIPTNIFHLGLILGIYDEEPVVPVFSEHDSSIRVHPNQKWKKFQYLSNLESEEGIAPHNTMVFLFRSRKDLDVVSASNTFRVNRDAWFRGEDQTSLTKLTSFIINANKFINGSVDKIVRGKDVSTKVNDAFWVVTGHQLLNGGATVNSTIIALPSLYEMYLSIKRPHMTRRWIEEALRLVGLESMAFTPHQLRHWINHHAKESGIPISIINLWSGRKDADQAYEYIHTTDEDNARQISSILVAKKDMHPSSDIKMISIEKVKKLRKLPASVMSEGICIQDLVTMPCRFLNDFMSSCFGCQAMCYVKGDAKALGALKLDLDVQMKRLEEVINHKGFSNNQASQDWYRTHFNKTSVLKALIDILEDDSIPEGSSVRMTGDLNNLEFRVQNLDTVKISVRQLVLENANRSLKTLIASSEISSTPKNSKLTQLLNAHGVSYDKT